MASVTIGAGGDNPRPVTIPPFRAFRATYAGVIVGGAFDRFQEVLKALSTFEREYAAENTERITRDQAQGRLSTARAALAEIEGLLQDDAELTKRIERDNEEEWGEADEAKRSELVRDTQRVLEERRIPLQGKVESTEQMLRDMGERGYVEFPGEPDDWQTSMVVYAKAMDVMPGELEKLLGLVVIKNGDLEQIYGDGGREALDEECQRLGRELLMQGDIDEILKLAAEAGEVIYTQLEKARSALGKLQALYARASKRKEPEQPVAEQPAEPAELEPAAETTQTPSSTNGSPSSSTPSPAPTPGGPDETSSSASPGASSAPSSVA